MVIEYFDAWGIPADETGRTDDRKLCCCSGNPGYKGTIPDNKVVVRSKEGHELLLHKGAEAGISTFDICKNSGRYYGRFHWIDEKSISVSFFEVPTDEIPAFMSQP